MSPQALEIIIFAAVAAFLLFRLKALLGTRSGHEDPKNPHPRGHFPNADAAESQPPIHLSPRPGEQPPGAAPEEPVDKAFLSVEHKLREPLEIIKSIEPGFTLDAFLAGAAVAYETIIMAFENGDKTTLKPLLSPDVFGDFEEIIDRRSEEKLTVDARFVGLESVDTQHVDVSESNGTAEIRVRFAAQLITSVRNTEDEVVEGDPTVVRRQVNIWVFERQLNSPNPGWTLVET